MRETEILFFLLVVIMIRSRKTGSTGLVAYLSNGFIYAKGANIILYFLADPRIGLVYIVVVLVQVDATCTLHIMGKTNTKRHPF